MYISHLRKIVNFIGFNKNNWEKNVALIYYYNFSVSYIEYKNVKNLFYRFNWYLSSFLWWLCWFKIKDRRSISDVIKSLSPKGSMENLITYQLVLISRITSKIIHSTILHLSKHDDNIAPDFIFSMTWNAALINMTLQKIVQQCCKYLIIIKKNPWYCF